MTKARVFPATLAVPAITAGFTLIELVMIIVIIGILAVSAQSLLNTDAFEQRYFADDALQALRYAQQSATTQGCAVQFEISNNTGFNLKQDADCSIDDTPDFSHTNYLPRPGTSDEYRNNDWPNGVTLVSTDPTTAVFYPQGWACTSDGLTNDEYDYDFTSAEFTINLNLVCTTGFSYEG